MAMQQNKKFGAKQGAQKLQYGGPQLPRRALKVIFARKKYQKKLDGTKAEQDGLLRMRRLPGHNKETKTRSSKSSSNIILGVEIDGF
jgi:hypothetical protein